MGVVFAVLSVLAISIKVFDRVDALIPAGEATDSTSSAGAAPLSAPGAPVASIPGPDDAETAAAIAVALALADAERGQSAGTVPSRARQPAGSSWVSSGRSREMSSRMIGQPRRDRRNR